MAQTISKQAIEKGTGKSWDDWLGFFESINAAKLTHKEIAQKAYDRGDVPGWWAQMVTVAYEQHIGRRVPGQDCDGQFAASISKTINGTMDDALKQWQDLVKGKKDFSDVTISDGPKVSQTDKWRYWRAGLADGSRLNVNIYQKSPGKAGLGIDHEKLESDQQAEHWRAYWKQLLTNL